MRRRGLPSPTSLLLVALLALTASGCDLETSGGERSGPEADPGEAVVAPVLKVVDGDTIRVELDGRSEPVRYIGINTPESNPDQPRECFGPQAAAANRELVEGERVRLVFDAEPRDRYDRLLAYVYLADDETFVNAELVRRGYARTLTIEPNTRYRSLFDRLQQEAANAGRGLWGEC